MMYTSMKRKKIRKEEKEKKADKKQEMFYLLTRSTHFIYGYQGSIVMVIQ